MQSGVAEMVWVSRIYDKEHMSTGGNTPYILKGRVFPLKGLLYELSRYSKCPFAKATR
jgi:hypothetical protein